MPERGYNADLTIWTLQQADALNTEFTRPHHTDWEGEVSITGAYTTITARVDSVPTLYENISVSGVNGVGTYGATAVIIVPHLDFANVVASPPANVFRVYSLFSVLDSTGAYPVPGGAGTAMLYYSYADLTSAGFTITTAPKVRYSINLRTKE